MTRINNFLTNAHLFKVFLYGYLFCGGFVFILFYFFADSELNLKFIRSFFIASIAGLPFGVMLMLMVSTTRKSQKFWDYAKEVDILVDEADTKEVIDSIHETSFQKLIGMSMGHEHQTELNRIYTIMQTKVKYLP
jgi:hypothetical protein